MLTREQMWGLKILSSDHMKILTPEAKDAKLLLIT